MSFCLAGELFQSLLLFVFAHTDGLSSLCVSPLNRSVQSLADKSKQEALKVDLMEALKRKHNS